MKALKKEGIARVGKAYIKTERYGRKRRGSLKKELHKAIRAEGNALARDAANNGRE